MSFLSCPRCGIEGTEGGHPACLNCNYSMENDPEADVPIPSWVLNFIEPTPGLLQDIREINFGIPPLRIPIHAEEKPEPAVAVAQSPAADEIKKIVSDALTKRKTHYAMELETDQCVA